MRKLHSLCLWFVRVILSILVVVDVLIVARIMIALLTAGIAGVKAWILHVGGATFRYLGNGRGQIILAPPSSVYIHFGLSCAILVIATLVAWWAERLLRNKFKEKTVA